MTTMSMADRKGPRHSAGGTAQARRDQGVTSMIIDEFCTPGEIPHRGISPNSGEIPRWEIASLREISAKRKFNVEAFRGMMAMMMSMADRSGLWHGAGAA